MELARRVLPRGLYVLCFSGTTTNLRKKQVDAEWSVLVDQILLQLINLFPQHVRRVAHSSDHTKTSSICNSGSELRAGSNIHTGEEDWVLNAEKLGDRRPDLLYDSQESVLIRSH